jgi:hypothetical protein
MIVNNYSQVLGAIALAIISAIVFYGGIAFLWILYG